MSTAILDWKQDRLGAARLGTNPTVLYRMSTGWAVIGDTQHLPGYCLLLHDGEADQLTELPLPARVAFMTDLALLGEAVQRACSAADPEFSRINYEILGNSLHHLNGHVHARYLWEPGPLRRGPVWRYGAERDAPHHQLDDRHNDLRAAITAHLAALIAGDAKP